ncbi:ZIP zinc transporter [Sphaerosporella brunnea]|uniref:ZIP zinc transporter n=1 Tax=Sphaerosporella brunnea TaxID=1250544 RepID=A0A5J5EYJ6_9PEZI|nr:ZIP zinc transporter [Sphaerosporella brunnea]
MSRLYLPRKLFLLSLAVLAGVALVAASSGTTNSTSASQSLLELSILDLDHKLQECTFVQDLNAARAAAAPVTSSLMKRVFAFLFPAGPAVNSLLATAYISGPPNFLLALCPADIDPASLSVMVAFAVGGLLGDTLLHLVPQTFMGEPHDEKAHFVLNDPNRNAVLGLFIFIGFATFVAMDKTLRILTAGTGEAGGHGHSHSHSHAGSEGAGTGAEKTGDTRGLVQRKGKQSGSKEEEEEEEEEVNSKERKQPSQSVKLSSLLNLISDFTHNITDGLAMSGAFYAGPLVGATTCMAVMLHEIPHEVGDFALLIQGGFTKWQAMMAQFVTALGAFTGTLIGIAIQEYSAAGGANKEGVKMGEGVLGTDLTAGDLVLPFTAGTFLYVGFSVIPELLETGNNKKEEVIKTLKQAVAMGTGFALMFLISE